jgi:hypothetical protein
LFEIFGFYHGVFLVNEGKYNMLGVIVCKKAS